jgi:hypothetical protein
MDFWRNFCQRWLWIAALAALLVLAIADTIFHLRTTWNVSDMHLTAPPAVDAQSPTGYQWNQHDFILPYVGMDGYHWVLQTQQMLATGDARIREVDYDNAPYGREVHWSSSFRWWLAALAEIDHFYTAAPLPIAVENVTPYANTILIILIVLGVAPLVARRFGSWPAAFFGFGMIGIMPVAESYMEGKSDHHGLAAICGLLTLLFLLGGGAGWVRAAGDPAAKKNSGLDTWLEWLPDHARARRWFIASGLVAGAGLWISAASEAPVLCEIGLGVLLMHVVLGRGGAGPVGAAPAPELWRTWGLAGATSSLCFYLLEYFPTHFGWRLEVNHPLYALAFAGGGEALCRLGRWARGERLGWRGWVWLGACAVAVGTLPAVALWLFPDKTFWVDDNFLYIFHVDYIAEFKSMARFVGDLDWEMRLEVGNALILLAIPMLFWVFRPWWAVATLAVIGLLIFCIFLYHLPWAKDSASLGWWIFGMGVLSLVLVAFGVKTRQPELPPSAQAQLLLALPPGVVTMLLSLYQMRWMEICYSLWLAILVAVAAMLLRQKNFRWNWPRRAFATLFLGLVLLESPVHMVYTWCKFNFAAPMSDVELMEVVTRDVTQRLRARLGDEQGVVVSGPTTTTWMIYWGGFKGLGTLYWENLAGLKATGDIYSATTPEAARRLIDQRGVTHLVIYSWDAFDEAYARLRANPPRRLTERPPADAFILRLIRLGAIPPWLRPIYYPMPHDRTLQGQYVNIYEYVPQQTQEEAFVRVAQWQLAAGQTDQALQLLQHLQQLRPDYLPGLIALLRVQQTLGLKDAAAATVQRVQQDLPQAGSLALDDRVDLAVGLAVVEDAADVHAQLVACLQQADVASLRRLSYQQMYFLLSLSRQVGLIDYRPGLWGFGGSLLPPEIRQQLLLEYAGAEKQAHHLASAVSILRQADSLKADNLQVLENLAWILSTAPDAAVRHGVEALDFAQRAVKLDQDDRSAQPNLAQRAQVLDVEACAYAECGQYTLAADLEQHAIQAAQQANNHELAQQLLERLLTFQRGAPFRDTGGA